MKIPFEWDLIFEFINTDLGIKRSNARSKVINGWLVNEVLRDKDHKIMSSSMVFIPDPNHEWEIE